MHLFLLTMVPCSIGLTKLSTCKMNKNIVAQIAASELFQFHAEILYRRNFKLEIGGLFVVPLRRKVRLEGCRLRDSLTLRPPKTKYSTVIWSFFYVFTFYLAWIAGQKFYDGFFSHGDLPPVR